MAFDIDVLVVGAGPASPALELGQRGVKVLAAERSPGAGAGPRAKTTDVRTRTRLRRWEIADRLAQASPLSVDDPCPIQALAAIDTDADVACPIAEKREALFHYLQLFEFGEPNPAQGSLFGPPLPSLDCGDCHLSDLPYAFGVSAPDGARVTGKVPPLSRKIVKCWTSPARVGNPNIPCNQKPYWFDRHTLNGTLLSLQAPITELPEAQFDTDHHCRSYKTT